MAGLPVDEDGNAVMTMPLELHLEARTMDQEPGTGAPCGCLTIDVPIVLLPQHPGKWGPALNVAVVVDTVAMHERLGAGLIAAGEELVKVAAESREQNRAHKARQAELAEKERIRQEEWDAGEPERERLRKKNAEHAADAARRGLGDF